MIEAPIPSTIDAIDAELSLIERELARYRHASDPVAWDHDRLGDTLWSGQAKILTAVQQHQRVAAMTCHGVGKSFDAAIIAGWWLDTHEPGEAIVVTTAPTAPQVEVILWKEIGRVHARGNLAGRVNQTEWLMSVKSGAGRGKEEIVGLGRKPNDYSPTAFQGIHARCVLVIVDEANGVRGPLWHAMDSLVVNEKSKWLIIGNPDDPSGEFFEACMPNSGWHVVQISAFDTPNFTGEPMPQAVLDQLIGPTYVERNRKKWAPTWTWTADNKQCVMPADGKLEDTHPFWQSKILGQFPVQSSTGSLIPLTWIRLAQERTLKPVGPSELGLDVGASEDGDPSCCGHRRGQVFRVLYEERQPDTMKTTGKLIQHLHDAKIGATLAKVDYIGVGRGVVDRAKEQNLPVFPISVGEKGTKMFCRACQHTWQDPLHESDSCPRCHSELIDTEFANLLSELWWDVRGLFERGEMDIDSADEELAAELLTVRWEPNSKGQTVVNYLPGPSPNRADALLMTFAPVVSKAKPKEWATW